MNTSTRQNDTAFHTASPSSSSNGVKKKKDKPKAAMASVSDTMSFIFQCGLRVQLLFCLGTLAAVLHGLVFPALAYVFSTSFSSISGAASNGLDMLRQTALTFVGVGAYALLASTAQGWCFELIAYHASHNFRLSWFSALLHQDPAFFDVYDIGGIAAQIGSNSSKYRRGTGRKFGEGIQFLTTGIGGLAYAFYSSWQTALVVLGIVPVVAYVSMMLISLNQTKGVRAAESYKEAGGVAYSAVSAIKTVLSLNAVKEFIRKYKEATTAAYTAATQSLLKTGFAHGAMLGTFFLFYFILTMFGTFLLYRDIAATGCDPSGAVLTNETCKNSGPAVFGAMIGIAFSAQGISQVGNFLEGFSLARVAAHEALIAVKRVPGAPEETMYRTADDEDALGTTSRSRNSKTDDVENSERRKEVKAVLPKFEIDSSSSSGLKPEIKGSISIQNVHFAYPTRPTDLVLKGLSLEVAAGQTVALVGPSGGGKSSVVAMLERFYDPLSGSIILDGVKLRDVNVKHLRKSIGYVGQEPTLFATTIKGNIRYGKADATDEEIEQAARLANAHDFITAMTDGYDTQVGDRGSQISGGQKQRIAIARVLVGNPRILLLDEATSALDAESELVVQDALDYIVAQKKITTVIVAHRLSTIRNADVIFVIKDGQVVERGNHDQLMARKTYYRNLVEKQEGGDTSDSGLGPSSRKNSAGDLHALVNSVTLTPVNLRISSPPHIEFRNVTFAYPSRPRKKVLENFSLVINQGQTVALVGPSGGGKSTTMGLIERFYDPNDGQVLYLGGDLKSLNVSWLRSQLSFVGQEPVLFNMSIAENIALGLHGVSSADIEQAARQANAHDFIIEFPEGYDTPVGSRGTQLSGGQKQRIAIARALVRKPKVLLLDEATSALDNESESIVQEAIDRLMQSSDHTVMVIAHRLSTIRNADAIALIADGKLVEYGSHDELIEKPHGRYKRLHESSKRKSTVESMGLRGSHMLNDHIEDAAVDEDDEIDWEAKFQEEEKKAFSAARARKLAKPDAGFMFVGAVGALVAGGVFPAMGILFSSTINLLFQPVFDCPLPDGTIPSGFPDCQAYIDSTAEGMKQRSFQVAGFWALVLVSCLIGNVVTFWGFGTATERLNKRVRDSSFEALLRQEVAFFDKRSVGSITSQLQDDAARIHAFSGEPVRALIVALASVVTGVVISFTYMWPFALVAIGCIPFMGAAQAVHVQRILGESLEEDKNDELNSPGGIIVETLLNMRTVCALALEDIRFEDYEKALYRTEPSFRVEAFMDGFTAGLSMFVQQAISALQFYFGGWLLFKFPNQYTFNDFLISNFSVLFALLGLGSAFQDMSDRKEVEKCAGRIFYLLDRKSEIDPLSKDGQKRVKKHN